MLKNLELTKLVDLYVDINNTIKSDNQFNLMLQNQVSQVKLRELDGKNNILIMIIFILIIYIITTLNGISKHNNDFISNNIKAD